MDSGLGALGGGAGEKLGQSEEEAEAARRLLVQVRLQRPAGIDAVGRDLARVQPVGEVERPEITSNSLVRS
jgi:hypothetical protein